ncbi:MAG TPA: hypothetical protein VMV09_03380 [Candidatus Saccharimonadales bacterium]|nr:hypothetical protein [Candidatus Saccharimonadales bacterium]
MDQPALAAPGAVLVGEPSQSFRAEDASRWQAGASVPEERFDRHLAEEQAARCELTRETASAGAVAAA